MSGSTPRNSLFPITQTNVEQVFGYIFAPWVRELGFKDFTVSEGYCSVILPLSSKVKFVTGSMCGQAIMAGVDTASGLASGTTERIGKGTVYQHTHFLSPASNDDYLFKAIVRSFRSTRAYVECDVMSVRTLELVARGVSEFAYQLANVVISNRSHGRQAARSHGHNLSGDIFNKEMTGMVENYGDLKLYFVGSGEVSEGNTIDDWDGFSKTLVAATSRRNALLVAKLYDQNKALPGTLEWEGQPITMVSFKDPNTGRYL